jgi:PAS domain S-box-containing protein
MNDRLPANESARLEATRADDVPDPPLERAWEDLVHLAAQLCGTPIAWVSLVDAGGQWFRACVGLEPGEFMRENSFCAQAVLKPGGVLTVPDATKDSRFAKDPLVTRKPRIRFYAGAPLVTPEGRALGTLCVLDRVARQLSDAQQAALVRLARLAVRQFELRRKPAAGTPPPDSLTAIKARLTRYQALFESSPDAIFILEAEGPERGRILTANPAAAVMHGYSMEELLRLKIQDLDTPQTAALAPGRFRQILAGHTLVFEVEHRRKDGTIFPVEVTASPMQLDGKTYALAIDRDLSERDRTKQALVEREQRLRAIFNVEPECVKLLDADGRLLEMNPAGLAMIEAATVDEVRGQSVFLLIAPEWRPAYAEFHQRVLAGATAALEFEIISLKGTRRWMDSHAVPLRDATGKVTALVAVTRDITTRKNAQDENRKASAAVEAANADLAETNRQLEESIQRANQMALAAEAANRAKSDFLATMSHEIRTPMNGVIGFTNLLAESELTPDQREHVEIIRSSSETLLALINDILDFSKIEAGRMEVEHAPYDLRQAVQQTLAVLRTRATGKGLELRSVIDPGVPETVIGDVTRLRQVLLNLIGNGIKFTERGAVSVEVRRCAIPVSQRVAHSGSGAESPTQKLFRCQQAAAETFDLHFTVRDTGIGIEPDRLSRLFKAFSQVDTSTTRRFGGTGLGLAISKRLVELMGGGVHVESTPGFGSAFHFTIQAQIGGSISPVAPVLPAPAEAPVPPAPAPAAETPAPTRGAEDVRGLRVLLVEDNRVNQALATALLKKNGCVVRPAGDGRQALDALGAEDFDLVLMDVCMPEMDGYEATRRIRSGECGQNRKHVCVAAMTANAMEGDREKCLDAGMDEYLSKPIDKAALLAVLKQAAGQKESAARRLAEGACPGALKAGSMSF